MHLGLQWKTIPRLGSCPHRGDLAETLVSRLQPGPALAFVSEAASGSMCVCLPFSFCNSAFQIKNFKTKNSMNFPLSPLTFSAILLQILLMYLRGIPPPPHTHTQTHIHREGKLPLMGSRASPRSAIAEAGDVFSFVRDLIPVN